MRQFDDAQGATWQVAPLDASYGQMMLVFSPLSGGDIRQRPMAADTLPQAEEELAALADEALRELLRAADPWNYDAKKL
ncbi:MAG: hypothetical protein OZ923_13740 [Comamonadaceae bacterium]|nr:hypothetical protein [Burkholderiales bacterium]MEB2349660.1 hypothetical protein [Comamonadaceae bacterium]